MDLLEVKSVCKTYGSGETAVHLLPGKCILMERISFP